RVHGRFSWFQGPLAECLTPEKQLGPDARAARARNSLAGRSGGQNKKQLVPTLVRPEQETAWAGRSAGQSTAAPTGDSYLRLKNAADPMRRESRSFRIVRDCVRCQ